MQVIDAKIRVNKGRRTTAHLWDGEEFTKGYPVAACGVRLYPRDTSYFMTPEEAMTIPFCKECLDNSQRLQR